MAENDPRVQAAVQRGFDPKDLYEPDITEVSEPTRTILERYSGIPSDQIVAHICRLRERAFKIYPYVCVGSFAFARTKIQRLPIYHDILERVKRGEKFLDVGCGFGQELRQLTWDGAPSENLYGTDLHLGFIDLGFELFNDRNVIKAEFIPSNLLDDESTLTSKLTGEIDVVYAALVFHHFTWEQQVQVAKRLIGLQRPKEGAMIVGRTVAYRNLEDLAKAENVHKLQPFHHDLATWTRLWRAAQEDLGVVLDLKTWEQSDEWYDKRPGEISYYLCFSVTRM